MIDFRNMDCMELMAEFEDNHFDLAIVDPPYGIGIDGDISIRKPDRKSTWSGEKKYTQKKWDSEAPSKEYFEELKRVSKNQIIWGGNYFTDKLEVSKCWLFWDKMFEKTFNFSHGELAWTSFSKQLMKFTISSKAETAGGKDRIHPTQKPKKLYTWMLSNFAKEGDLILDTHVGSASSLIACNQLGFDVVGCELDSEYYQLAQQRIKEETAQLSFI